MIRVELNQVTVTFKRGKKIRPTSLATGIKNIFNSKRKVRFKVLDEISFSLYDGDVLGIIGKNGAGKSTLLRVINQVLPPDTGSVSVNGRVSALLSLGAGFLPDLTGRQNIYLNGVFLGLSRKEVDKKFEDIVEFAELEDFIDTKIRYYSSGMKTRLGFSVAVHMEPDILILDEVMSTGDKDFQKKAKKEMMNFMNKASVVIMVNHNTSQLQELCNKCMWIDKGRIIGFDSPEVLIPKYEGS